MPRPTIIWPGASWAAFVRRWWCVGGRFQGRDIGMVFVLVDSEMRPYAYGERRRLIPMLKDLWNLEQARRPSMFGIPCVPHDWVGSWLRTSSRR